MLERILNWLFPDRCAGCRRLTGDLFCAVCRAQLRPYPPFPPPVGLDAAWVAFRYEGGLVSAIHQLKYGRRRRVAHVLGDLLAAVAGPLAADALIAVPLHSDRLRERGFNQAAELAARLQRPGNPPLIDGLVRVRATNRQARLAAHDRTANVNGAFVWVGHAPPPPRLILIDDVLTTGATLAAGAAALRAAGAQSVTALALARSVIAKTGVQ
ncbi:ComF family protein [uncultured Chloroflexus sp.]|uniref:ComF family protein n=1 Tax=uncultured Chloroflexus sp. TaxID=214040 RepID=UPI00260C6514|nr:ComF family protein [uncultured Chloroflexus sp.]